jgi:sugar lactone lactonase YvrE
MSMNRLLLAMVLAITSSALPARLVSAHPSSGIVVDEQGQVYFQDIVARTVWKIDAQGKLTKYYEKLGGHWIALDSKGSFSRADLKLVNRITPFGARPALIIADGGAPIVVSPSGDLYYGHEFVDGGRVAPGLTRISPGGRQTLFSPDLKKFLEVINDGVTGLAAEADGSVHVATWNAVLKLNMDGTVARIVHPVIVQDCDMDPADHKASNRSPCLRGLAVNERGTVYVAATSCHRLLKIATDGKLETVLKAERPWSPTGVAVHGEDVYVLEYTNANGGRDEGWLPRVRKLAREGKVTTLAIISRQDQ